MDPEKHATAIPPPHAYGAKNEPIPLFDGPLELRAGTDLIASGSGSVCFQWLPDLRVVFELDANLIEEPPRTALVRGIPGAADATAFLTQYSLGGDLIRGVLENVPFEATAPIAEVRFLVGNLRSFGGETLRENRPLPGGGSRRSIWAGRIVLCEERWRLTLDERSDYKSAVRRLRDEGGIDVTHVGSLALRDGGTFTAEDADEVLNAISGFLGFVRGLWAPPFLAVGFAEGGDVVWRDWTRRHTSSWSGVMSAFDDCHPEYLEPVFCGYLNRWRDILWNEPLRIATQMYVEANGPVMADTSLFLSLATLELITWVRWVEELGLRGEAEFDQVWASDRLRELLGWLSLSFDIPPTLTSLVGEAGRLGWIDGPHAISEIRNALVHPRKRERLTAPALEARIDLHELALWYVELAMLRLVHFEGEYANRIGSHTVGVVEPVPWR